MAASSRRDPQVVVPELLEKEKGRVDASDEAAQRRRRGNKTYGVLKLIPVPK